MGLSGPMLVGRHFMTRNPNLPLSSAVASSLAGLAPALIYTFRFIFNFFKFTPNKSFNRIESIFRINYTLTFG